MPGFSGVNDSGGRKRKWAPTLSLVHSDFVLRPSGSSATSLNFDLSVVLTSSIRGNPWMTVFNAVVALDMNATFSGAVPRYAASAGRVTASISSLLIVPNRSAGAWLSRRARDTNASNTGFAVEEVFA